MSEMLPAGAGAADAAGPAAGPAATGGIAPWLLPVSMGLDVFGGLMRTGAATREGQKQRSFWRNIMRQRQQGPIGTALKGMFQEQMRGLEELPGYLRRERLGRLTSAAQERMSRFERNLARSGATRASTVGMMGERGIARDIERMGQAGELAERQMISGERARAGQTGQALLSAFYPSPGQAAPGMAPQDVFYNPTSAVQNALMMSMLGRTT